MNSLVPFNDPASSQLRADSNWELEPQWYAIHTRSQHERAVAFRLQSEGVTTFLPLLSEVHRWSDRRKIVEMPLFSCYAFVHMRLVPEMWAKVLGVNGVLRVVGTRERGIPIPENRSTHKSQRWIP